MHKLTNGETEKRTHLRQRIEDKRIVALKTRVLGVPVYVRVCCAYDNRVGDTDCAQDVIIALLS